MTFLFLTPCNVSHLEMFVCFGISGIMFSSLITGVITDSIKDAVGRPRPNFFLRCFPNRIPVCVLSHSCYFITFIFIPRKVWIGLRTTYLGLSIVLSFWSSSLWNSLCYVYKLILAYSDKHFAIAYKTAKNLCEKVDYSFSLIVEIAFARNFKCLIKMFTQLIIF